MANKKIISLFLLIVILGNVSIGCSSNNNGLNSNGGGAKQEFKITAENPVVIGDGIDIVFTSYDIENETNVTIERVEPQNIYDDEITKEDVLIKAFEIKTPEIESFTSLINIEIPYDDDFIEVGSPSENVGAMYYDESLQQWIPIPFELDLEHKKVRILTNHLSTYSIFTIRNENTRAAQIVKINSYPTLPSGVLDVFEDVINEAMENNMSPGQKSFELGQNVVSDWLNMSGASLTTITQTLYASEFAQGLGNAFTNVGLAAAMVQAAYDFSNGDDTALFSNLTKNLSYFSVGKWGSNALQLGFVGVYAIDYSINKFATTAWDGRKEIWYSAYNLYYEKENKRSAPDWYRSIYSLWEKSNSSKDPNFLKTAINDEIETYVNAFWRLDEVDQAFWQSEVQKTGFSGGGGLNEALKKQISGAHKAQLVKDLQQPVFDVLERNIRWKLMDEYAKELVNLRNYLNQVTTVLITENLKAGEKSDYDGYIVRFGPLNDTANASTWTGTIKSDGTVQTRFTALGHIQSGAPDKLFLYKPDANPDTDVPEKEFSFVVNFPNMQINLKEMHPTIDQLVGDWQNVHLTFPDIKVSSSGSQSEDGECDLNEAMLQALKTAQLKCKFEIQKIDETTANLIFGIVSGVNTSTGKALDVEPDPPITSVATYKDGVFTSNVSLFEANISLKLDMKQTGEDNITFVTKTRISGTNEDGSPGSLPCTLTGQKY